MISSLVFQDMHASDETNLFLTSAYTYKDVPENTNHQLLPYLSLQDAYLRGYQLLIIIFIFLFFFLFS